MAGRPLTVTVGTVWSFHVDPPPPRPPRLSVAVTVTWTFFTVMQVVFGAVYFRDCPQHPNIPNYLLGLALMSLLMIPFTNFPCESFTVEDHPRGFRLRLFFSLSLVACTWALAGAAFVFSAYQPYYDPAAAGGVYCNKNLYTFAFWNAVRDVFSVAVCLAKHCSSLMVGVSIRPAPGHSNV